MLVPFVIDHRCFKPDPHWSEPTIRACYNNLLDSWLRSGLLAIDGCSLEDSRLFNAIIESTPIKYDKRFKAALAKYPKLFIPDWDGTITQRSLQRLSGVAKVAIVTDDCARQEFGFGNDRDHCDDEYDVAICRVQAFNYALGFRNFAHRASGFIRKNISCEEIWQSRFADLAQAPIKNISIVDRFSLERLVNEHNRGSCSGLERFLHLLDQSAHGDRFLKIFAAHKKYYHEGVPRESYSIKDAKDLLTDLFNKLPRNNIKRISVTINENRFHGEQAHDRYIRFERYAWDVGNGLSIFEGDNTGENIKVNFNYDHATMEEYRKLENETLAPSRDKKTQVFVIE